MAFLKHLLLSLLLLSGFVFADDDWSLVRDSNNIKVWTRLEAGHPVRTFKATTVVRSTVTGLVALILDTANASRWIYRIDHVEVLSRDDEKASFVVRVVTDFPWPLNDRDVVVMGQVMQDEKTGIVNISSHTPAKGQYADVPGYVRIPDFDGQWQFRPLSGGLVEVTMTGRADPGGIIPASAVNLIIHETPYYTLKGLRKVIGDPRYQKAQLQQIREP
ncbi:MAG TPA: START domain-containing protein [Moraxellaceae bacterium]